MSEIRKLNLSDLMLYVLKQWKKILIFALILCLVMGGLDFLKLSKNKVDQGIETVEKSEELIDVKIESYSKSDKKIYARQEEAINNNKKGYDTYSDYQKNSIKMQLNPEAFYEGKVECVLSGAKQKDVLRFKSKCEKAVKTVEFCDKVRKKLGVEIKDSYIQEILSVSFEVYEDETGLMTFKVKHFDEKSCLGILDVIQQEVSSVTEKDCQSEIINSSIIKTSDIALTSEQNHIYDLKWSYYDKLIQVKADRKALETKYNNSTNEETGKMEINTKDSGFNTFKVVMGFFSGVILAIIYYALKYLFSDLIHTKEDINGLNEVSIAIVADENKTIKCFVERWILKLEKKIGNVSSNSLEMDMMPIIISLKQKNIQEVCLTSTLFEKECDSDFVKKIKGVFGKYDIKALLIKSILNDIDSLQKAVSTENVVLYEGCEKSSYKKLSSEVLKLHQCGIEIQGIILEK